MKILLVRLSNKWVYGISKKTTPRKDEPLGIEYLANGLLDHDINLLDMDVEDLSDKKLRKYIESISPEIVGITVPTPLVLEAKKVTKIVKETLPNALVVVGGPHPSSLPIESIEYIGADISVFGEGEETIKELARGLPLSEIKGIAYRKGDKIKINSPRKPIENLDDIPFPERNILPREKYLYYSFNPEEKEMRMAGSIMSSRSCPYQCIYCASKAIFGNKIRFRSPENVVDEIEELVNKYKIRHLIFWDDCFTLDQKRTKIICEEIIKRRLEIEWKVDTRVNTVSRELLVIMKKAGCKLIVYGVETGNQRILNLIKKATTVDIIKRAFKLTREVGINRHANFMIGHPTETENEIWDSINLAKELDPDQAGFYLCMPIPGSELYEMAKKKNAIKKGFEEFRWYGECVHNLSAVSAKRLKELQGIAYKENPKRPYHKK